MLHNLYGIQATLYKHIFCIPAIERRMSMYILIEQTMKGPCIISLCPGPQASVMYDLTQADEVGLSLVKDLLVVVQEVRNIEDQSPCKGESF